MNTLGERIKEAREAKGLLQSKLADIIGVRSSAVISNWEQGVNRPDVDKAVRLCQSLGVSIGWLLGCEDQASEVSPEELGLLQSYRALDLHGKRLVDFVLGEEYARMTRHEEIKAEHRDNITYINCYDLAVSAGTGEPWGETYYKQRIEIPTERVPDNAHYCVRINGNSMEPAYKDGDIVFVEHLDGSVRQGEIGIFYFNGGGLVKRLGNRELISLNPEYSPIPVHEFDRLECQGRVLGKL